MDDPDTVPPFSSEVHADAVRAFALSYALGGVTILLKGQYDIIASSDYAGSDYRTVSE
jgi:NAD(P)H-hydrate repair Nnr-like enzyme with NAD(P)H-hydrate dehydratase domain